MFYSKEQLYEIYRGLPEEIQDVMASMNSTYTIRTIGQKYGLHIDKIGELSDEIGLTMLGLTKSDDFLSHLKNRLQLDQATAEQITREVNGQIFLPIRESLMKLHANEVLMLSRGPDQGVGTDSGGVQTFPTTQIEASAATEGELPDKDKLLSEIENSNQTETDKTFEKKLGQLFRIPREEVDLDPYSEKTE